MHREFNTFREVTPEYLTKELRLSKPLEARMSLSEVERLIEEAGYVGVQASYSKKGVNVIVGQYMFVIHYEMWYGDISLYIVFAVD